MTNNQLVVLQKVAIAAERLVARMEYVDAQIEGGTGHMSVDDEIEEGEIDTKRTMQLREAVKEYRTIFPGWLPTDS